MSQTTRVQDRPAPSHCYGATFVDMFELIANWQAAKTALDAAKAEENRARLALLPLFPDYDVTAAAHPDGTAYVALNAGWRLKGVFKTNYTISKAEHPAVLAELTATGNQGSFIADRLFTYDPKLALKEYKGLSDAYKRVADNCITTSAATPTFELVEPKAKQA